MSVTSRARLRSTGAPPRTESPRSVDLALVRELARAASQAPSPDNNQPWLFVPTKDGMSVEYDRSRSLPSDAADLFGMMALGAAMENVDLAARERGLDVEFRTSDAGFLSGALERVATVRLREGGTRDPLYRYILSRRTNRRLYESRPLPADDLESLARSVSGFAECRVTFRSARSDLRRLALIVGASDRMRFEAEPFHAELHRQLRLTPSEATATRDGLDLRTLEVPPGTGLLLRSLRPWPVMRALNAVGASRMLAMPSMVQVFASGAIGFLSVPSFSREDLLRVGRAFQRLWLTAESLGLSLHPLGSLPVYLAHLALETGALSREAEKRIERLGCDLRALSPEIAGRCLTMMFRVGKASRPAVRSLRRRLDDVLGEPAPGANSVITSSLPRDNGEAWSYEAAFSRNLGLIDEREQDRLRHARVAIAGQGGVGGVHLVTLARMGIGRFTIADPDTFETANTNRQFGALRSAVGGNKAEVMAGLARDVNPELEIHVMPVAVEAHNQDDFLRGADVLVDGLDAFELPARRRLFTRAAELGIPTITAGPIGFSTAWLVFDPDGMTFDEYFDFHGDMDPDEMFAAFVAGLVPEATQRDYLDPDYVDVEARTGPSVAASCQLAAGVVGGEVAKLLLGRGEVRPVPCYSQFDPFVGRLVRGRLANGNRGPLQRVKRKLILNHLRRLREGRLSD